METCSKWLVRDKYTKTQRGSWVYFIQFCAGLMKENEAEFFFKTYMDQFKALYFGLSSTVVLFRVVHQ